MGRYSEFEVTTGMEIVSPDTLMVDIAGIGNQIFTQSSENPIRMWEGGRVITPKSSGLVCIDPDKLKYYHLSLIAERVGKIPLEFLQIARHLDPALALDGQIGGGNLKESIANRLYRSIGERSIVGRECTFDYLDMVESAHYPGYKVFVLKQLDPSSEGRKEVEAVTAEAQFRLAKVDPGLASIYGELIKPSQIVGSVPVAYTKHSDAKILSDFRETFTENLIDPGIVFRARDLDISNVL